MCDTQPGPKLAQKEETMTRVGTATTLDTGKRPRLWTQSNRASWTPAAHGGRASEKQVLPESDWLRT